MNIEQIAAERGYGANADAFQHGFEASTRKDLTEADRAHIAYPGPDRLAFQAGWTEAQKRKVMRVPVTFYVVVDKAAYEEEYGETSTKESVREDVRARAREAMESHLAPFMWGKVE